MPRRKHKRTQNTILAEIWTGIFVSLYLLFPGFSGFQNISGWKTRLFYLLAGLLIVFGAILFFRDLRRNAFQGLTIAQAAALAFLGFTVLSAVFSSTERGNPWYSSVTREGAVTLCLYVLMFLILSRWGNPAEMLYRVLFWTMIPFCFLCLLQLFGANPLQLYPAGLNYYDGYGVRYKGAYLGTIGNVDLVSAFLALVSPMLLLHAVKNRKRRFLPELVLALVCLIVLFWIRVLCGPVGLIIGSAVCLAILCPDKYRARILLLLGGAGIACILVLWLFDLPIGMLHELHEILHGRFEDSFGTGRFYIWRQMLARIPKQLWFGVGPDMVRYSGLTPFYRYDSFGNIIDSANLTDAHCYPLQILYCQGLPALLSWLSLVGVTLVHWIRARRDAAISILGAGLVCFLCAMLFCISSVIIMPFCWLTMALIEARYARLRAAKEQT